MAAKIRKVNYVYIKAPNRAGQATRVLTVLRDANVNLLAFSGFPERRGTAQIDLVTDDLAGLKRVADGRAGNSVAPGAHSSCRARTTWGQRSHHSQGSLQRRST